MPPRRVNTIRAWLVAGQGTFRSLLRSGPPDAREQGWRRWQTQGCRRELCLPLSSLPAAQSAGGCHPAATTQKILQAQGVAKLLPTPNLNCYRREKETSIFNAFSGLGWHPDGSSSASSSLLCASLGQGLDAAIWPRPSCLHVGGFPAQGLLGSVLFSFVLSLLVHCLLLLEIS